MRLELEFKGLFFSFFFGIWSLRDSGLVVGLELQFGFSWFLVSHSFRSCLEFALVCQLGLKLDLRFFTLGGVGA